MADGQLSATTPFAGKQFQLEGAGALSCWGDVHMREVDGRHGENPIELNQLMDLSKT